MKFHIKTPSKNLGKLMRSGGTAPSHPTPYDQKEYNSTVVRDVESSESRETCIKDELEQLDVDSFESILKNVAASKTDLLKNETSRVNPTIMGLIDDAKERHTAEKEHSKTTSIKDSVKFDDDFDFIDDGVEEVVMEKPALVAAEKLTQIITMKSPVCGNPVTDYDKINQMNSVSEQFDPNNLEQDPMSLMEKGQCKAFDEMEREARTRQKYDRCDEKEQMDYLQEKGLFEFCKFGTILGPVSHGEFTTFKSTSSPIVASELGVMNPVSASNLHLFQTCTANGRLLPAIPRKFFAPNEASPKANSARMTNVHKPPVTMMLRSSVPSLLTTTLSDSQIPNFYSQSQASATRPPVTGTGGVQKETVSQKKRNKLKARLAAKASVNGVAENDDINSSVEENDKQEKDVEDEEKENKDEGMTEEELEARRNKNRKQREKKKAKKEKEVQRENEFQNDQIPKQIDAIDTEDSSRASLYNNRSSIPFGFGAGQQEDTQKNQNGNSRRTVGSGGKNKKNDKSVSSEYTVGTSGVESNLEAILKELGINDLSELSENPGKKNKKANNNNNNSKKNKQQQNQKKDQKEVVRSPPIDNEPISVPDGVDESNKPLKSEKKMDDGAVAASVTKRCSSGVGQQSEEDDNQSYVSAQENLGGSNSRLYTPPGEFIDAQQSREETSENVMADLNNYRVDDDVDTLAKQLQKEEEEFITVGKNNKKTKKQPSVQDSSTSSAASSTSPKSRQNAQYDRTHSSAESSNAASSGNGQSHNHYHPNQRNNNRPVSHTTTLGDFMDSTKKDTHKNIKHKKSPNASMVQKKQTSVEEPISNSPMPVESTDSAISINTAHVSTYASIAGKSGNSNPVSPVPLSQSSAGSSVKNQAVSPSSVAQIETKTMEASAGQSTHSSVKESTPVSCGVQLPPSTVGAGASDISFGYEETAEDKLKRQQKVPKTVSQPPQKPHKQAGMNGVELLNSLTMDGSGKNKELNLQEMPVNSSSPLTIEIQASLAKLWDKFCNTGTKPVTFKPEHKK